MMDLFHSAAIKLTVWYLLIIMSLSLLCSGVIYHFSSRELAINTRRQVYFFNDQLSSDDFLTFSKLRQQQLDEATQRLQANLVVFNLIILISGGAASYILARRTMQPIERALETQSRFAGDASHELRTPLAAMQSEIEVALRDRSLGKEEAKALLKSNLEETIKLKTLSDGLLRLASTDAQPQQHQNIDLKAIATESLGKWTKAAKLKQIEIATNLASVNIIGDYQSLVDLVSILLDNAVKYSPQGGKIELRTYKKDRCGFVSVKDYGLGIKPDELPRIFERLYRSESSRTKEGMGGYGLGLAIAKKIADVHKSSITVTSSSGRGSTFTLKMPLHKP